MNEDNDDDLKPPRMSVGDMGTILLAGVFLLGFLYMMFAPSPLKGLFDKKVAPAEAPATEVTVTIPPKD